MNNLIKTFFALSIGISTISEGAQTHKISVEPVIDVCTGYNYSTKSDYMIYPNPVEDAFYISPKSEFTNTNLSLFDSFGKIVKRELIVGSLAQISTKDLPRGVYFLTLQSSENLPQSFKIILK